MMKNRGGELKKTRLESLDILRGLDMFVLSALGIMFIAFRGAVDSDSFMAIKWAFSHQVWEGLSTWDMVMPLFIFMSGITIPFALSKYRSGEKPISEAYVKIVKRFAILWILGMVSQGNLLGLNPDAIFLYSNTLQSIALGYLVSSIIFLHVGSIKIQVLIAALLLIIFWAVMQFVSLNGFGAGDYTPAGNLAGEIDRVVLGRFRDGATVQDGVVVFSPWYTYTWILSSLNFVVTAMTGMFAGYILKSDILPQRKWQYLFILGVAMVSLGWFIAIWHPVIKNIWTSSMVLVTSGYSFLLMTLFYYIIDYRGWKKGFQWLKIYGMNSIVAYMLMSTVNFSSVSESVFRGFEPILDGFYPLLIAASNAGIILIILLVLYKQKLFLKV